MYEEGVYLRPVMAWKVPRVIASARHPGLGKGLSKVGARAVTVGRNTPSPSPWGGVRIERKPEGCTDTSFPGEGAKAL